MKHELSQSPRRVMIAAIVIALIVLAGSGPSEAQEVNQGAEVVGGPVTAHVVDVDLRDLPVVQPWRPGDPVKVVPRRFYPPDGKEIIPPLGNPDPLVNLQASFPGQTSRGFTTPLLNIAGIGFTGVSPPDTVGDVGPNHYIQSVNGGGSAIFNIYDKTGTLLVGPLTMESLGTGSCASGMGDPIVLYDRLADRWFLQEFTSGSNDICIYISQGPNPVSDGWYHYRFTPPNFPDYPHFGVWPDAYYATSNEGNSPPVYALDRENMLTGGVARPMQRFTATGLPAYGFEALTPADLDGAVAPPSSEPGIIMRHYDDEAHASSPDPATDSLQLYEFQVDWDTPANSTFFGPVEIAITDFNSWLMDYSTFYSVPQPGTSSRLDPIREVILNRLQYRNFGDHESLVGNLPTNINPATSGSTVNAGVRWFELRRVGAGSWTVYQEGTFSQGVATQNRFMGAIAMDQTGNIGLGYSITDTDAGNPVYPSLRFTGRTNDDPLSVMSQGETDIVNGTTTGWGRWGDYAAMSVDPADDCTFWFTSEYTGGWSTQIVAFRFDACGCDLSITPPLATATATADNRIDVTWNDSATAEVTEYRVYRKLGAGGTYEQIATVEDTNPPFAYLYSDVDVSGGSTYFYHIRSSDGSACLSDPSNEVSATATGACTLAPTFDGVTSVLNAGQAICSIDLEWTAAIGHCGPITYSLYRSTTSGFTPGAENLITSGISEITYRDSYNLSYGSDYYYIVRAQDGGNGLQDDNTAEAYASPSGPGGGSANYPYTGAPVSIPDDNPTGISATLHVDTTAAIDDILVNVDVSHTFQGDLIVRLTSPAATEVTLHDRSGGSADDIVTTYDTLTAPDGPGGMADFDGENPFGDWILFISDNAGIDLGTLNAWSLDINTLVPCETEEIGAIFRDGFESGSTAAWPYSQP